MSKSVTAKIVGAVCLGVATAFLLYACERDGGFDSSFQQNSDQNDIKLSVSLSEGTRSLMNIFTDRPSGHVTGNVDLHENPGIRTNDGSLLMSIPFTTSDGTECYLEAYVSDTQNAQSMTRGAIINENSVGATFTEFKAAVYNKENNAYLPVDASGNAHSMAKLTARYKSDNIHGQRWVYVNEDDYEGPYKWPDASGEPLTFYSWTEYSGMTDFNLNPADRKISFHYTTPCLGGESDAQNQPDLLFGIDDNSKTESGVALIHLRHALAAVKFIRGDIGNVAVLKVTLKNFYQQGTCSVTFDEGEGKAAFAWSDQSDLTDFAQSMDVSSDAMRQLGDNASLDLSEDGSRTFLIIPQEIDGNAEIIVTVQGALHPEDIVFHIGSPEKAKQELAASADASYNYEILKDWSTFAGKTVTFKVSSKKVNSVKISLDDDLNIAQTIKSNISITNVGNKPGFIRATIIGNWVDESGNILAKWDENATDINTLCGRFKLTQNGSTTIGETFPAVLNDGWFKDGECYYYKHPLEPDASVQTPLFYSFEVTQKPVLFGTEGGMERIDHLELDIMVQAVTADAGKTAVTTAWGTTVAGKLLTE